MEYRYSRYEYRYDWMANGMSRQRQRVLPRQLSQWIFKLRQSVLLHYWLIPKSNNLLTCLYKISLGGKLLPLSPMSREYLPCKATCLLHLLSR
ncbi:hypothetical protein V6N13_053281 [Hibiscus sabdariffa]